MLPPPIALTPIPIRSRPARNRRSRAASIGRRSILLQRDGYAFQGFFMSNGGGVDEDAYCTTAARFPRCARVAARKLGIVLHTGEFAAQSIRDTRVVSFLREYAAGRTRTRRPVHREIKFAVCRTTCTRLWVPPGFATGNYDRLRRMPLRDSANHQAPTRPDKKLLS